MASHAIRTNPIVKRYLEDMEKQPLEVASSLSQLEKLEEQTAGLENLPPDVKGTLNKIKALNNFELGQSILSMLNGHFRELAKHFTNIKNLNIKLNIPNADIKRIYTTNQARDGINSYQAIESMCAHNELTKTVKDHLLRSGFNL
jgi:hypothetical protein